MTDLPEIKIVKHVRAKRLRLRVEPDAVRLTVPVFCTQQQIQAFLAQSQTWLEKTWQQQMQQRNATLSSSSEELTFFNDLTYRIVEHEAIKLYRLDQENK
ncbi:YgjP-like metallopeptidase domain-containing protein [Acinetobacter soli]